MTSSDDLTFRPLYLHVRDSLFNRLIDGRWKPGMLLPSEQQLAGELGVAQGTVRKALDALALENFLVRKQGRGTYVAFPEEGRLHFQFYRLRPDGGDTCVPDSTVHALRRVRADAEARERLGLRRQADVWELERTRSLDGRVVTLERVVLSVARFPKLDELPQLPNNVYVLYAANYSQIITRATERLKAVTATAHDCELLDCRMDAPLLLIDRVAYGLDDAPVEWRVSRSTTADFHYLSELK